MENKIKTEPGTNAGKAPAFKPKFVPKVPIKQEKPQVNDDSRPVASTSSSDQKQAKGPKEFKPKKDFSKKEFKPNDNNRNRDQRGKNNGGRGPWVMPMGMAFFSGNATAQLQSTAQQPMRINNNIGGPVPIKSENNIKVARPNEVIDDEDMDKELLYGNKIKKHVTIKGEEVQEYYQHQEYDSDDSQNEGGPLTATEDGVELWPPAQGLDPTAPLSLPLGPKTVALRRLLANEPILAQPNDEAALDIEERLALFLIQLPADLHLQSMLGEGSRGREIKKEAPIASKTTAKLEEGGKLGKLQLLKSGKVRLVTNDGRTFEVSSGLASSFQQCLASADLPPNQNDHEDHNNNNNNNNNNSTKKSPAPSEGSLYFMGNITKKLVLTPEYEIDLSATQNLQTSQNNSNDPHSSTDKQVRFGEDTHYGDDAMLEDFDAVAMQTDDI